MVTLAVPLPVTPAPAVTLSDAARHVERGGERAAVDVRHRDAGDRQGGVLGDALRARHGIDRRVVHRVDGEADGIDGLRAGVAGRDRERVEAVEVEVAGVGQAGKGGVDLGRRAADRHSPGVVVADTGAGG